MLQKFTVQSPNNYEINLKGIEKNHNSRRVDGGDPQNKINPNFGDPKVNSSIPLLRTTDIECISDMEKLNLLYWFALRLALSQFWLITLPAKKHFYL